MRITKKVSSNTLEILQESLPTIEKNLDALENQFRLSNEVVKNLTKSDLAHWDQFYTKSSSIELFSLPSKIMQFNPALSSSLKNITTKNINDSERNCTIFHSIRTAKPTKQEIKQLGLFLGNNKDRFVLLIRANLINYICALLNKEFMFHLLKAARKGNDEALFKAINLDKNLIWASWINKRIGQATLKDDREFLTKLGKASGSKISLNKIRSSLRLTLFLHFAWYLGLNKLTDHELALLINNYDIYTIDAFALKMFRNRLGLKRYAVKKIDTL
jgi:hypothetical protein